MITLTKTVRYKRKQNYNKQALHVHRLMETVFQKFKSLYKGTSHHIAKSQ